MAATALVAALALNATAMLRSAGTMEPGASRDVAESALRPAASLSARLRLDRLRAAAEAAERRFLEPPPPVFPEPAIEFEDDETDDADLDEFLFDL